MASDVTELAQKYRQYNQARNFAGFILEREIRDRKSLITALALDSQVREQFYNLFDGIEHIPTRESTVAAARRAAQPERGSIKTAKGWLHFLRNFANLTARGTAGAARAKRGYPRISST